MNLTYCGDTVSSFLGLFDLSIAPTLLYYFYIPIGILTLFFGLFVFIKNKKDIGTLPLLILCISFFFWVINEIVTWVAIYNEIIFFSWQIISIIQLAIILSITYSSYNFFFKKYPNFKFNLIIFLISFPVILLTPTSFNVATYDLSSCEGYASYLWNYIYLLQILLIAVLYFLFRLSVSKAKGSLERKSLIWFFVAIFPLNIIFLIANILSEMGLYQINLLGSLAMLFVVATISFSIVKFKTFNIKLILPQVLVFALIFLNFAILFIRRVENVRIVIIFTIIISSILGYVMIRSVKKEIKSREHIQKLADELEIAGEAQAETLRFITHQVKGVFTNTKGALSSILEGDYDPISESLRKMVQNLFVIQNGGVDSVQAFLSASQLENGNPYVMKDINFKDIVSEACIQLKMKAEKKGLVFETSILEGESYKMMGDGVYLSNAILNIINNAVCYTKTGSIHVALSKTEDKFALFSVKDTGVGITQEDGQQLFTKYGHGKDSRLINVDSNGLGLYLVKKIIDAHQGTVWYESEVGEGTTFFVKLPLV